MSFCAVFSVIVVSDAGSPITTFKLAAVSMRQWEGEPSGNTPPDTVSGRPADR